MNLAALVVVMVTLVSCSRDGQNTSGDGDDRDSLMQIISQKDEELNDFVGFVNEIEEGFQRIGEAEGRITVTDGDIESASQRESIRENMTFIQETMKKNKALIAQLEDKLRKSSGSVTELNRTLDNLKEQMGLRDAHIQELMASLAEKDSVIAQQLLEIGSLTGSVTSLTEENRQKSETVASQEKELNEAWFVFGTKAELKEQKILSSGDVLRSDDFNKNYFTEVDIRTMKEIKLYSHKAEMLTSHPDGSYTLKKDQSGDYVLTITNYKKFWSVSKFLVVLVK